MELDIPGTGRFPQYGDCGFLAAPVLGHNHAGSNINGGPAFHGRFQVVLGFLKPGQSQLKPKGFGGLFTEQLGTGDVLTCYSVRPRGIDV